eukprot:GHVL01006356.1.p2 GENE.GHVL01006356.1~~GHVL01006356.1.p2  ORF type:complete len:145 (+),score=31.29 GHVL01006356.1:96-530(+)
MEDAVKAAFLGFSGGAPEMEGRDFVKLCKTAKVVDSKCTATDVDLIFAKIKPKGGRKISFNEFYEGLRLIAEKKKVDLETVTQKVCKASPTYSGTVAENVRFHDDKSSYTGVHAKGGPSTLDQSKGLSNLLDRSSADVRGVKNG